MSPTELEKRVAILEKELTKLKNRVETVEPGKPWWERITGTFEKDPVYEQAMKLGRNYRQALSSSKSPRKQK
ncbi:MAG: hypothetical protein ABSA26_03200 [Thermoguttaceae bacterium]|jgi:hypothetical protein